MMTQSRTTETVEQFVQKHNWSRLIEQTAAGDESAFAQFYKCTSGLVFALLLRILGQSQMAEEVIRDVYEEIRKQAGEFDEEREKPLTWLITITHLVAVARLNSTVDKQPGTIFDNNANNHLTNVFNSNANISTEERLVRSAINALSPAQREILELAYFSGMKEFEIAAHLGQPLETVNLSLELARKKLHTLFNFLDLSHRAKTNSTISFDLQHTI